jgi:hypothetical protein
MILKGLICNNFFKPHIVAKIIDYSSTGNYVKVLYFNSINYKRKYKSEWFEVTKIAHLNWEEPMTKNKLIKMLGG